MKLKVSVRLFFGLVTAVIFGAVSYFAVLAQPTQQVSSQQAGSQQGDNCYRCHPALYASWHESSHGQAWDDPEFQEKWDEQENSGDCLICHTTGYDPITETWAADGISCSGCHDPIPEDHPDSPVPIDRTASLCEQCHSETVYEWKTSVHKQSGLDCVDCHGQHTTTLKADNSGALCSTCHHDTSATFTHSIHSDEIISCPDCHLETFTEVAVEERGYVYRDHDFQPKISSCENCHELRIQNSVDDPAASSDLGVETQIMLAEADIQGITNAPDPVNPVSFAIISAIIGMVAGLLLAPIIQERYKKFDFVIQTNEDSELEK